MRLRNQIYRAIISFLLLSIPQVSQAAPLDPAAIEQLRKIVREELAAREREIDARERRVSEREQAIQKKTDELDKKLSQVVLAPAVTSEPDSKVVRAPGPFSLEIEGYGDMHATVYDYDESENQHEGSRGQSRSTFDTERFVLELEGKHEPSDIELEAEIEFEHGGTGSELELEYEEFGEFESEIEKGGEVILEEIFLQKDFGNGWSAKAGRFYVAMGTLSSYYRPTDYMAVRRPEVEEVMLPGQWDEIGLSVTKDFDFAAVTLQVVNGLDSTGFDSARWVAGGHQSRFESARAEDLAFVGRVDVNSLYPGLVVGAAIYAGNTSGNRPRDDLDVDGTLVMGGFNYRYWSKLFRTQGALYVGSLSDADEISERNSRLPNSLGVARTPVAEGALGLWSEVGLNVLSLWHGESQHDLFPFFRFDYYDTNYETSDTHIANSRYERFVYTVGLAYLYDDFLTLKLNWAHRNFGSSEEEDENFYGLGIGFVY